MTRAIKRGDDPGPAGWTPLARAAVAGSSGTVLALLESGADSALTLPGYTHVKELVHEHWPEGARILALLAQPR